jgi:hypothetical protein
MLKYYFYSLLFIAVFFLGLPVNYSEIINQFEIINGQEESKN